METIVATTETVETAKILTPEELDRYQELKRVVSSGLEAFVKVGQALTEIREKKLYKCEFNTWPNFCGSFRCEAYPEGLSAPRADQLIRATQTAEAIAGDSVTELFGVNESILRALRKFPEDQWKEIYELAVYVSRVTENKLTAPFLEAIAQEVTIAPFEELQRLFASYGGIERHIPRNFTERRFLYRNSSSEPYNFFETVEAAIAWYNVNLAKAEMLDRVDVETKDDAVRGVGAPAGQTLEQIERNSQEIDRIADEVEPDDPGPGIELTPVGSENHHPAGIIAASAKTSTDSQGRDRDERWTPPEYWEPALDLHEKDGFDLDPATCDESLVPARVKYTQQENGLIQEWHAELLWLNPPYSQNEKWTLKLQKEVEAGRVVEAYILEKTDNRTAWYQRLLGMCSAFCLVDHPIKHLNADHSSFFPSTIFYIGPHPNNFARAYKHLGFIGRELTIYDEQF